MVDCNSPTLQPQDMWKRIGFMRHAQELWLLANLITERMYHKRASGGVLDQGMNNRGAGVDPVLNEFDQNNMRQVNELITSFENAHIV